MKLRSLFVHEPVEERPATKAERRVATLQTHDLVPWAEQCLYTVGKSLNDWSKDGTRLELLDEAQQGAETLQVLITELQVRAAALVSSVGT